MKLFNYSYKHDGGDGMGSVEARNAESAEKKVTEGIVLPPDENGEPQEPKNLKVTITEA